MKHKVAVQMAIKESYVQIANQNGADQEIFSVLSVPILCRTL